MFVALGIQHEMRMRPIFICGLIIFPHIISYTAHFSKKKSYWIQNVCFDFLYKFYMKYFSL